uniref:Uncharacterized protein n=1 Tax=Gopherus agassizii TaxID=38772 RepID=A0A452H5Y0_9SAUR
LSCPAPALSLRSPHHLQAAALGLVSAEPGTAPGAGCSHRESSHGGSDSKTEGAFVHAGNTLAPHRITRRHPRAHVGMGCNKALCALEDGTVRFTKEVYVVVLYKTFINLVLTKEVESFKLVTML